MVTEFPEEFTGTQRCSLELNKINVEAEDDRYNFPENNFICSAGAVMLDM